MFNVDLLCILLSLKSRLLRHQILNNDRKAQISRGERLKKLRSLSGLTAVALAEMAGLSRTSISYWENASRGGLTRKGAEKIIDILSRLGINCDINWLWFGDKNPSPITEDFDPLKKKEKDFSTVSSTHTVIASLEKEMEVFLSLNKHSVITRLNDELMLPFFLPTDMVGGIWQNIETLYQKEAFCIIKMKNDNILRMRKLKKIGSSIQILHTNKKIEEYIYQNNAELATVAPLTRLWRY